MRRNTTRFRKFKTSIPKSHLLKKHRKKFSSSLSTNYALMLQLYYLNKKQAATKKELRYEKLSLGFAAKTSSKSSLPGVAWVAYIFTESFSFFRKTRPGIALATE